MAGVTELSDIDAKKKALIAEAEVYRQTLKLEIQNLRLCTARAKKTFTSFSVSNPMLVLGATLLGSILKSRKSFQLRATTAVFLGWQLYQKIILPLRGMFWRRSARRSERTAHDHYRVPEERT